MGGGKGGIAGDVVKIESVSPYGYIPTIPSVWPLRISYKSESPLDHVGLEQRRYGCSIPCSFSPR